MQCNVLFMSNKKFNFNNAELSGQNEADSFNFCSVVIRFFNMLIKKNGS